MNIGIIDIETTGFTPAKGFIVEVGIVSLDTDTGEVKTVFDKVCREEGMTAKDRDAWIFSNSDLAIETVREALLLSEMISEIQAIVDALDAVTAFNKAFDFPFLRDRGIEIAKEWPCPMLVATNICKLPSKNGYNSYKWPKVEEAWQFFFPDEPYIELHRGADDALHEAKIVHELFKLGKMTP